MTPAIIAAQDRPFCPQAVALLELLNRMDATTAEREAVRNIIDAAGLDAAMRTVCAMLAARAAMVGMIGE